MCEPAYRRADHDPVLVNPPLLDTKEDALRFVRGLTEEGVEVCWHEESKRLVTRPKKAGKVTMEKVKGLLRLGSPSDWGSLREKEGLG